MKVVIAGGSGFVGHALVERFLSDGAEVVVLTRDPSRVRLGRGVRWSPGSADREWHRELDSATHVINLAGENIGARRWSAWRKDALTESRLVPTRALVEAIRASGTRPQLISASAIGWYGDRGDELLDETSARGGGFLSDLTQQWEAEARAAEPSAEVVILRLGIVLAPDGGALEKMLLPFRMFAGGPFGNGRQWMSWIDRDDLVELFAWVAKGKRPGGIYNATSPNPVRNREFAKTLGSVLHRPAVIPAPAIALKTALGEMAGPLLLEGQKVMPARAIGEGFEFRHATLESSLRHLLVSSSK
jgi:uncharacterized protein